MLEYICICIILMIFIPILYVRIRYPFWSTQPVFHTYDYFRFLTKTPYDIHSQVYSKILKTHADVHSKRFLDMGEKDLLSIVDLLQSHSIESEQVLHLIDESTFAANHVGQFYPSYVTFYTKDRFDVKHDADGVMLLENTPQIIGCMTGRAMNMFILDKSSVLHEKSGYLWDNICVHREYIKDNLVRKMIPAHDTYQRTHTPDVSMSMFKREVAICEGVVPLVEYNVFTFTLSKIRRPPLPAPYSVSRLYNDNVEPFYSMLYTLAHSENAQNTTFISFPEVSVLDNLIKKDIIIAYGLSLGNNTRCIYVFKNPQMCYDNITDGHIIECITTITEGHVQDKTTTAIIFAGFLHALHHIYKSFATKYKIITFHNLGHNGAIIERWKWKYTPLSMNKAAYYLYNSVIPGMPIDKSNCIIIT